MGCSIITKFFLTTGVIILLQHHIHSLVRGAPTADVTSEVGGNLVEAVERVRGYSLPMLVPRIPSSRSTQYIRNHLLQAEPHNIADDFILYDEDVIDFNKCQSKDYGHTRFGKRGDKFDDYGLMRFGDKLEG